MKKNQKGFSTIELVLVLVIVALIGVVGYMVYKNHNKATLVSDSTTTKASTQNVPTKSTPDPYTGWKTDTLQYEKITYKYPADWTVKDNSYASTKDNGCTYPGTDNITLTSPSDDQVIIRTGMSCFGGPNATVFGAIPAQSLGQSLYLAFENSGGNVSSTPTAPSYTCLATSTTPVTQFDFKSKNIFLSAGDGKPVNEFCYYPYNLESAASGTGSLPTGTLESIKNSKDFATAKLIFESMKY